MAVYEKDFAERLEQEMKEWYAEGQDPDKSGLLAFEVFRAADLGWKLFAGLEDEMQTKGKLTLGQIHFKHHVINEEGEYLVPLFTRMAEIRKGPEMPVRVERIKDVFRKEAFQEKCLGFVINCWEDERFILFSDMIQSFMGDEIG